MWAGLHCVGGLHCVDGSALRGRRTALRGWAALLGWASAAWVGQYHFGRIVPLGQDSTASEGTALLG